MTTEEMNTARGRIGDVPVKQAILAWNDGIRGDGGVLIVPRGGRYMDDLRRSAVFGACNDFWARLAKREACYALLVEAWRVVIDDRVAADEMHKALLAVPELREIIGTEAQWPHVPRVRAAGRARREAR